MSTTQPASARRYTPAADATYSDEETGSGWVAFAGSMLLLVAVLNFIYGVAAVSNSTFFVGDARFVVSDLNTWGWVLIAISVVQLVTAVGVWLRWAGVRWIGVLIAGLNAIAQLMAIQAYPFWALCVFTLDILVIYGLIAHGRRSA